MGPYPLMIVIAMAEVLSGVSAANMYYKGSILSGKSTTLDFCYGKGNHDLLHPSLEDQVVGLTMKNLISISGFFLIIAEVLIYVFIYTKIYIQNESMVGVLTKTALQKRKQGNVVTLSGQLVCFAAEITSISVSMLMTNVGGAFLSLTAAPMNVVIFVIQGPLLSLALIWSSPELSKYAVSIVSK